MGHWQSSYRALIALGLVLAACGGGRPSTSGTVQGSPGSAAGHAVATPAKRLLRYRVPVGTSENTRMHVVMETKGPTFSTRTATEVMMHTTVTQVDEDGTIWARLQFTDFLIQTEGSAPRMLPGFDMAMEVRVSPRGQWTLGEAELPPGAPPQFAGFMATIGKATEDMVILLPDEPVAIGHTWTENRSPEAAGIRQHYRAGNRIIAMDGNRITIRSDIEITAEPEQLIGDSKLIAMEGSGKVTKTVVLDKVGGQLEGSIHLSMTIEVQGAQSTMSVDMHTTMTPL